jgi:hypothetical protein
MKGGTPETPASVLLPIQARVFEAVASNSMVTGSIHDLARQFGVTPITFVNCLGDLIYAGWVTVTTTADGLFSIQLDRDDRVPA